MKNQFFKLAILAILFSFLAIQACDDDDDDSVTDPDANQEFVADNNTFADWDDWTLVETVTEPSSALQGFAHGGDDTSFTRKIYIKDNAQKVNGMYPKGTLIIKHLAKNDNSVEMYTAMAKRGEDFNEEGNGWEWFFLKSDGSIDTDSTGTARRGGDLNNNGCEGCHSAVSGDDFVFTNQ